MPHITYDSTVLYCTVIIHLGINAVLYTVQYAWLMGNCYRIHLSVLLCREPGRVAGRSTVDILLHPHLSACLVAVVHTYSGLQTST